MKTKILYTITQGHWGGAQKYVADLALYFAHNPEYEITAACGEQSESLFAVLKNSHVKTIRLRHLVRAINPLKDVLALNEIIEILKTGQFDIVHANSSKAGFLTAIAHAWLRTTRAQTYRARLIYTAHGWIFMEPLAPQARWMFLLMERIAARLRDATIVLSKKEKTTALRTLGMREGSIYVIPNGIDCARIHFFDQQTARERIFELRNSIEIEVLRKLTERDGASASENSSNILRVPRETIASTNNRLWIGTIANLYKTKGVETLIRAASILRKRVNTIKSNPGGKRTAANLRARNDKTNGNAAQADPYFFVIGEGPERSRLQRLIQTLNLSDSFFLVGAISEASHYLKAFDLFVLPSLKEGFPYTILEASCAGIPIIASDVGAIPEIIQNGENGLLMPHGNSIELAKTIERALTNQAICAKLQTNAPTIANEFSFEKTIKKTKNVYLELKKGR